MSTINHITLPDGTDYNIQTTGILYGQVDSTSTSTAFTATIPGITSYYDGLTILLKNGVVSSAANFTINVNNLGAKGVYNNMAAATRESTLFNVNYTMLFIYDSTRVSGGGWILYRGYDSNTDVVGYMVRTNVSSLPMTSFTERYRILFESADGAHFVPATNSTSTDDTTARTVCQDPINPFGRIVYYGTAITVPAGSKPAVSHLWEQCSFGIGYSFVTTLTPWKPVYVKCAPQSNGSAIIDSTTPFVQALPSAEDGKIYIYLGIAYSTTSIEMVPVHPVYYYKDGAIRLWTNVAASVSTVSVTQTLSSGTEIGSISVDGTSTSLYAPTPQTPPSPSDATPQALGTAAAGSSADYSRADHVHAKPTYSKSDVGLGNVDNVQQYSASNPPPYPVESVNGQTGAVSITIPTKTSDLTNDSGYITGMTILSYGSSTWNDFITAYNANKVVYCRASSNSNPASGTQNRLAPISYVNNTPTIVEFQYYRSVNSHTESQQGDQVFIYKLDKTSGWSVTTREASVKVAYSNGITGTYSNGVMTLKHANTAITVQAAQGLYPIAIDAYGHITGYGSEVTSLPASDVSSWAKASTKPSYTASEVGAVATSAVGAASGVAPLNASSKIDQAYLPSYVDDVIEGYYYNSKFYEEAAHTTEITGEAGKIYVDLSTDKTYRYGGSTYAEVGGGSLVTISRNLTSGTKSAIINIDGTSYDIYSVTNTDEKLKVAEAISGTTYYPVVSSNSTDAETKCIDSTGFNYTGYSGGTNNTGNSLLTLGNSTAIGTVGNKEGRIRLYGSHSGYGELYIDANMTANRLYKLPNNTGTIALTSDIPSVPSWALASTKPSYALSEITGTDDIQAIEALSGTTGLLKKTAANTWTLDTTSYTTNTGTVTQITAGSGLSMGSTAGGSTTTSGTINHTNSVTAQTTQALYPIKIDAQGHISAYGTAVTSLPASDVSAWAKASTKPSYALSEITGASDVQAIEALSGTSGLLKKTAADTWTLDTTAYTTNTGTVTKVTAGTGLAIGSTAQGNFTTSGTINHTNSVTAQTTQALYPIKIDSCGHISAYGTAVTSLPASDVSAWAKASTKPSYALSEITGAEDVQAIEGLTGTSGILKKTAANTWTLDTTAYTTNTGTVTKVTAGTGLAIGSTAQGNFTTTGTINHTNSVTAKSAAAQSAKTLTWGGTFTLYEEKYDTEGHITGVASYNMTMPSNPNTDTKQNITLATTSKAYLTGVTTTPTSTAQALTGVADTGVYLTATAGEISAIRHSFNVSGTEKAYMAYNNTTNAIDFIFV